MGRGCSFKQLVNNANRVLMIDRSRPQFMRLSSPVKASYCLHKYVPPQIPSSSLFDGLVKTTRRMSRFYKRTISEYVPSSLLVRPDRCEETDEAVHFHIGMPVLWDEDIKVSVEKNKTVTIIGEGNGVFEASYGFKKYVCYIDLPDIDSPVKMYTTRGVKANKMYGTGMVEIIIPKLKPHEKPDDENVNERTFDVKVNRTFYRDIYGDNDNYDDDDEDEDDDCDCDGRHNASLGRFYAYVRKLLF